VEEEVVVTRRLVLKEEIHLHRVRTESRAVEDVTVRRETAEVLRSGDDGQLSREEPVTKRPEPSSPPRRRNRILKDW
jgi:stress response protein YsnF